MDKILPLKKSFSLSLCFHVILFLALVLTVIFSPPLKPPTTLNLQQSNKIVQAVSVNAAEVNQEIARLKSQQQAAATAAQQHAQMLQKQALQAAKLKAQQEAELAQLKAQQQQALKAQQAQLAAVQKQQAAAKQQLASIQQDTAAAQAKQQQINTALPQAQQKKKAENQLKAATEKNMQQQLDQDATQLNQAKQQQINSELAKYTKLIRQAIAAQWIIPASASRAAYCVLDIQLGVGGVVNAVQVKQSSGDRVLDRSAMTAVYKASPLPVPADPQLFKLMQDIQLKVQPDLMT